MRALREFLNRLIGRSSNEVIWDDGKTTWDRRFLGLFRTRWRD